MRLHIQKSRDREGGALRYHVNYGLELTPADIVRSIEI